MNLIPLWNSFKNWPGGKWLFSRLIGKIVPYSGTVHARVELLEKGRAVLQLQDRRRVRNHLKSIHAVALMNLCELTTGLALVGGLPSNLRAILVEFRIEYRKKARGRLTAKASCPVPSQTPPEGLRQTVTVEVMNEENNAVCLAEATWLIRPSI